jgi:hypothetical protein
MKKIRFVFLLPVFLMAVPASAQHIAASGPKAKVDVYYFHLNERCPIDQSIEDNAYTVMQTYFSKEIHDGTINFRVLNTDDKANAAVASGFDINTQALYVVRHVNGKAIKKDLTDFAFEYSKSNPSKFKMMLKGEVEDALK